MYEGECNALVLGTQNPLSAALAGAVSMRNDKLLSLLLASTQLSYFKITWWAREDSNL